MLYLILQILFCVLLAALIGGLIGWFWRSVFARRGADTLHQELVRLRGDLGQAKESLGVAQSDLKNAGAELEASQTALGERDKQLASKNGVITELEAQLDEQKQAASKQNAENASALETAQGELKGLLSRHEELKSKAQTDAQALRRELEEAQAEGKKRLQAQAGETEALSKKVAELEERLTAAETQARKGNEALEGVELEKRRLQKGLEEARATAARRKQELSAKLDAAERARGDEGDWREKLEQCQASSRTKDQRIAELESELAKTAAPSAPAMPSAQEAAAAAARGERPTEIDDLKKIYGIGPKLEKMLHGLGVFTFRQIANWTAADIEWVDRELEEFPGRIVRDDWVGGARKEHRKKYG